MSNRASPKKHGLVRRKRPVASVRKKKQKARAAELRAARRAA